MLKVAIVGVTGRMGRELVAAVLGNSYCTLAAALARPGNKWIDLDVGEVLQLGKTGVIITDRLETIQTSDAIIDFTSPELTMQVAELAAQHNKIHIIGTTGLTAQQQERLKLLAQNCSIVCAGNMSVGINVMLGLIRQAASALGPEYDVEIVEMHHKQKKDAPSGTALMMGEEVALVRQKSLHELAVLTREGANCARSPGEIGFASLRGGQVIGDHTIIFAGESERIEISHKSASRSHYAQGAVRAALWAKQQSNGFYNMQDVLR